MENLHKENRIGVDVSKDKLDTYHLLSGKYENIENNVKSLTHWAKQVKINGVTMVTMEKTGGYEERARLCLVAEGVPVHIAHPMKVHYFAKQKGVFAKTDRIDAKVIAEFSVQEEVTVSPVPSATELLLKQFVARRSQLVSQITTEKCRIKPHLDKQIKHSLSRQIKGLEKEVAHIEEKMQQLIDLDTKKKAQQQRLETFQGVGSKISTALVSGLPELGTLNREEIAALVGVAPRNKDSGRKTGKRMVAGGRFEIRKLLYMAALVSIRHNKTMRLFYEKLKAKGKPSKVALVAVMRKIIITLNSMLKYETNWGAAR
jgi:transposase